MGRGGRFVYYSGRACRCAVVVVGARSVGADNKEAIALAYLRGSCSVGDVEDEFTG